MNRASSPVGSFDIHAGEDRGREPVADQHVPTLTVLPDVVQERAQQDTVPLVDVTGRHDLQRIFSVGCIECARYPVERPQQVHVDGVAVVRVTLRATTNVDPLWDQSHEQPRAIQGTQSVRRPPAGAEDPQERVADRNAPPELVRRRDGFDGIELVRRQRPPLLHGSRDQRERVPRVRELDRVGGIIRTVTPDDHVLRQRIHGARMLEDRPHQPVRGHQPGLVLEPHHVRDVVLLLSKQPIRAAAALQMQGAPHPRQELLGRLQLIPLGGSEQAIVLERPASDRLEPAERVDVPQTAAAFFQLRFQQVGGRTETLPPVASVARQPLGEPLGVAA